jgi:hypothetical protein
MVPLNAAAGAAAGADGKSADGGGEAPKLARTGSIPGHARRSSASYLSPPGSPKPPDLYNGMEVRIDSLALVWCAWVALACACLHSFARCARRLRIACLCGLLLLNFQLVAISCVAQHEAMKKLWRASRERLERETAAEEELREQVPDFCLVFPPQRTVFADESVCVFRRLCF